MEKIPDIELSIYWPNVKTKFCGRSKNQPDSLPETIVICDIFIDNAWKASLHYDGHRLWLEKSEFLKKLGEEALPKVMEEEV